MQAIFHDLLCDDASNQEEDSTVPVGNCEEQTKYQKVGIMAMIIFRLQTQAFSFLPPVYRQRASGSDGHLPRLESDWINTILKDPAQR